MIKTIVISVWAALLTAIVFYFRAPHLHPVDPTQHADAPQVNEGRTDAISVPIFKKGAMIGHLTTRVRYKIEETDSVQVPVPVELVIGDGLFELVSTMKAETLTKLEERDLVDIGISLVRLLESRKNPLPIQEAKLENTQLSWK